MASSPPRVLPVRNEPEPVTSATPEHFAAAVATLARATLPPDAIVAESPPPARIAPWAAARSLELGESASGRLVYLYDPAGQPSWAGCDRLVAFARVEIDAAMSGDPMLSDVVWDWLREAMSAHDARAAALGGTVTTTASRRYGSLVHLEPSYEVELRCSWSPAGTTVTRGPDPAPDLAPHLAALLAAMAAMRGEQGPVD